MANAAANPPEPTIINRKVVENIDYETNVRRSVNDPGPQPRTANPIGARGDYSASSGWNFWNIFWLIVGAIAIIVFIFWLIDLADRNPGWMQWRPWTVSSDQWSSHKKSWPCQPGFRHIPATNECR